MNPDAETGEPHYLELIDDRLPELYAGLAARIESGGMMLVDFLRNACHEGRISAAAVCPVVNMVNDSQRSLEFGKSRGIRFRDQGALEYWASCTPDEFLSELQKPDAGAVGGVGGVGTKRIAAMRAAFLAPPDFFANMRASRLQ